MKTYTLTDDEIVHLDGKCRQTIQNGVEDAKKRIAARSEFPELSSAEAAFIANMVAEAEKNGKLVFYRTSIRGCSVCDETAGYAIYTKSGRHHNKGDKNYDKPLYMNGIEFADRFVTIKGYTTLGCCEKCWKKIKSFASKRLALVNAAIPESITGIPPRFIYRRNVQCCSCQWSGHEGEMIHEATVIGNGTYPARCPECHALNSFFSLQIKTIDGFTLEENKK